MILRYYENEDIVWVQSSKKRKGSNSIRDVMRLPVCWLRQPMLEILRMSHAQVGMAFRQKYAWLVLLLGSSN